MTYYILTLHRNSVGTGSSSGRGRREFLSYATEEAPDVPLVGPGPAFNGILMPQTLVLAQLCQAIFQVVQLGGGDSYHLLEGQALLSDRYDKTGEWPGLLSEHSYGLRSITPPMTSKSYDCSIWDWLTGDLIPTWGLYQNGCFQVLSSSQFSGVAEGHSVSCFSLPLKCTDQGFITLYIA